MSDYTISLAPADHVGTTATSDHFGTNVVFTRDYLDRGGPFDRMFDQMNFGAIRFPGGTFNEEVFGPGNPAGERFFDIYRPSGLLDENLEQGDLGDEARIVTVPAAIEYANEKDVPFNFVIPTANYLSDETDANGLRTPEPFGLYRLMDRVDGMIRGEYGDIDIDMLVIGNEFWYRDERMTAEEYGRIVNDLAIGLERVFDLYREDLDDPDSWQAPKIAAQVSQGWKPDDNQAILDQLSDDARGAIDVVVTHFYPRYYEHVGNSAGQFDRLDDWQNADGFGDLEYYISEWNTSLEQDSDMGLKQASTMLEIMRTMLIRDVDHASIWGVQYQNLKNRMAELDRGHQEVSGGDYRLTPAGEIFRMMNPSLQDLRVLDIDTPEELRNDLLSDPDDRDPDNRDQLVMHAFSNDDRAVVFLSSRTDEPMEITLDYEDLIDDYSHVWAQKLGVINDPETDVDNGDPTAAYALPYLTSHTQDSLQQDGEGLTITLGAYEIVKFEFTLNDDIGLHLYGHDQVVDPDANYDDTLIGGQGDDLIEGHFGDNLLIGTAGQNTILGGVGDDVIEGGDDDDLLIGGGGDNHLSGGTGNDTLVADGSGVNTLVGGEGMNHFVVSVESDTIIEDFRPDEGQTLSFLRHYDSVDEVFERAVVEGDDIVILHDGGGTTELLGAAEHFDSLGDALADQMAESPTDVIVDDLLTDPPDGEIEEDPEAPDDEGELRETKLLFSELLNADSDEGLQEFIDNLDEGTLVELAELMNPAILHYTTTTIFDVFLNALPDEAVDDYYDRLPSDILDDQFLRFEEPLPPDILELRPYVLTRTFDTLSNEGGSEWLSRMDDEDVDTLLGYMEEINVDPARWEWFSSLPDEPEPPPDDDDDDDDDDDPPSNGGGGCFVATCAYGSRDHPDVAFLQTWRDLVLADHRAGRAFIRVYWIVGPVLARLLAPFPRGRAVVRWLLGRLVRGLARVYRDG